MLKQKTGATRLRNSGEGPGEQTFDGCSVDFYARLKADEDELRSIELGIAPPATMLELGCGTGRLTHPLTAAGFTITAVDNSEAMLSHVQAAQLALSDIESLNLNRTFDAVLLASRLLNSPLSDVRSGLLASARRHLAAGGYLIGETHNESIIHMKAGDGGTGRDYAAKVVSSEVTGNQAKVTLEYRVGKDTWRHQFATEYLAQDRLLSLLENCGFEFIEWLDERKTWFKARAI